MKLSKRIITVISSMLVVGSGVGVGVGLLHLESKPKKEIKNLKELITITNLETIHESNMNRDDLINLIRKRNPDLNLDFDRLELDIYKYERKVIVKPKHEDTTYQGEVEIAFNLSSKLSDLLWVRRIEINEPKWDDEILINLIKQENRNSTDVDFSKLTLELNEKRTKVIIKPKPGVMTYSGEVEVMLTTDLSILIKERKIWIDYPIGWWSIDKVRELFEEANQDAYIDFNLIHLEINYQEHSIFVVPRRQFVETYKGRVELIINEIEELNKVVKVSNLGKITQEQKTEENLLKLIGEKNPNLDMKKLELDYTNNKTFLIPKPGSKGYKNKVEIRFDTLTNQDLQVIEKVKSIWNREFKDKFSGGKIQGKFVFYYITDISKYQIQRVFSKRLESNGIEDSNIQYVKELESTVESPKEYEDLEFVYKNIHIKLNVGKVREAWSRDFHEYHSEKVTKIGYFINSQGDFQIGTFPTWTKKVSSNLPKIINDLSDAFEGNINTRIDGIEKWNTSNITNMSTVFRNAVKFNQDISNWDTSNVTDMSGMFSNATNFNQNISNWDTSNVTDMSWMFYGASSFNQDISNWNTSNVTNMRSMFNGAKSFNQDISNWNVFKCDRFYGFILGAERMSNSRIPEKFRK